MSMDDLKPPFPTEIIEEGRVKVLAPRLQAFVKSPSDYAPSKAPVFYNPIMEFNRDLAILAMQTYQMMMNHEIKICEPLTGTGVRGIRFAAELRGVQKVVMGDINEEAYRLAKLNVKANGLASKAIVKHAEANQLLGCYSAPQKRFDAIDVDPFGSPVRFLDSAVRALRDGGLIAVTATDMAPLCGVHPRACIRKYGGKPLRTEYCHELAARLLAGCLSTAAARQDIGTDVVFSHRAEHYVRIYAIIHYGAKMADMSVRSMGYIRHCFKCLHRETESQMFGTERSNVCPECGSKLSIAGPLWLGSLWNAHFIQLMSSDACDRSLGCARRVQRMLNTIQTEVDAPITYYVIDKVCDSLNLPVPSVRKVMDRLNEENFQTSLTHFSTHALRSNAPASKIREVISTLARNIKSQNEV